MTKPTADKRTKARRKYSAQRVLFTGIGMFALFGALAVVMYLILIRFLPSEIAVLLAISACIGSGVVIAIWATEGGIELQSAHVHAHLRKALAAVGQPSASSASYETMRGM